jgi:hypothetical protein
MGVRFFSLTVHVKVLHYDLGEEGMMKYSLKMMFCALTLVSLVPLWGCNQASAPDNAGKPTYEQLAAENETLKQELAALKSKPAEQPAAMEETAPSETSPMVFKDIDKSVPTSEMINDLAHLNVFENSGPEFKPYQPVTRGEYVVWLYHAYNKMRPPEKQIRLSPSFKVPYTDITDKHPAYKYVQAMANAGYSVGYEDKTFKPDQPITREEMIGIKHGVDGGGFYTTTSLPYSDSAKVDKRYVNALYADMIMDDGPKGSNVIRAFGPIKALKPKEPVLRYEAAATLWQTDGYGHNTASMALGRK